MAFSHLRWQQQSSPAGDAWQGLYLLDYEVRQQGRRFFSLPAPRIPELRLQVQQTQFSFPVSDGTSNWQMNYFEIDASLPGGEEQELAGILDAARREFVRDIGPVPEFTTTVDIAIGPEEHLSRSSQESSNAWIRAAAADVGRLFDIVVHEYVHVHAAASGHRREAELRAHVAFLKQPSAPGGIPWVLSTNVPEEGFACWWARDHREAAELIPGAVRTRSIPQLAEPRTFRTGAECHAWSYAWMVFAEKTGGLDFVYQLFDGSHPLDVFKVADLPTLNPTWMDFIRRDFAR